MPCVGYAYLRTLSDFEDALVFNQHRLVRHERPPLRLQDRSVGEECSSHRRASWNEHPPDRDRIVEGVVQFVCLADTSGSENVHRLRHTVRIDGAVWVSARRRTDSELEVLGRRLEAARLIGAETILTR